MSDFLFATVSTALFRSAPVVFIGLILLTSMRRSSGANRHMVCVVTVFLLLLLPVLNLIPQKQDVSIPVVGPILSRRIPDAPKSLDKFPSVQSLSTHVEQAAPSLSWAKLLLGVYFLGIGILALRHLAGYWMLTRKLKSARRLSSNVAYPIQVSHSINVPLAIWWKQPIIVLPAAALDWSEARLGASIRHEAAHIRRGDLVYTWLAFIARLAYWPNPLVWILSAKLLESAEIATDDCVLQDGVNANDYAEVLVQTASESRRNTPVYAPAMARSSRVGRRVHAILDPLRKRGGANPAIALSTGAIITLSALAMGRVSSGIQALHKVAPPSSPYEDVRNGSTVSAEASNNFIGSASDGRKVRLVQIERWTPGGVEAWKPDGTPLPVSQQIKDSWRRHNPAELHLYTQFENDGSIDDSGAGIGSGPSSLGEPEELIFAGGGPVGRAGSVETIMSILEVPRVGHSGVVSVTFGYSEQIGDPFCTIYPNGNENVSIPASIAAEILPDFGKRLVISYPEYATPFVYGPNGQAVKDGHGGYLHRKVLSTKLTYTELTSKFANHFIEPVAYRAQTLKPIKHNWNEAHQRNELYDFSYYWPVSLKDIDHIDVALHKTYHVTFLDFHLRPRQDKP